MFRAVVVMAALTCVWGWSAEAEPLRKWTVGSWEVSEHEAFCMGASPSLMSGTTSLMFAMNTDDELIALVGNQSWKMRGKSVKQVFVTIDRDYLGGFPTVAISPGTVAVKLPAHLIPGLQDGVRITMQFDRATYTFPLRHTRFGLEVLAKCAREKAGRGSGASAAQATIRPPATRSQSGTGFFVSRDGQVLTNEHVVGGCSSAQVTDRSGRTAQATITARDTINDLALLRTGLVPKEVVTFRTGGAQLGEAVAAFGFPFATVLASSGNFTKGDVSATVGLKNDTRYLQFTAPIQPGNSGGPLLDYSGNVVGTVTLRLRADIGQNVNFAIKAALIRDFLESNRVEVIEGAVRPVMTGTELADRAQAVSVFIRCDGS